jgi:hypothetical protein
MVTYVINKGSKYPSPRMIGTCGERLEFDFILNESWNQLYLDPDNSTHKICGVSDLFGSNSMRLGVRRRPEPIEGLVAVPYLHIKGKIDYGNFDNRIILLYKQRYKCIIQKVSNYWTMKLFQVLGNTSILIATCNDAMSIGWPYRLSGTYIEVGSAPSKWTIKTEIEILK